MSRAHRTPVVMHASNSERHTAKPVSPETGRERIGSKARTQLDETNAVGEEADEEDDAFWKNIF